MELKEKITKLEEKDFNWFEIADILGISYELVRATSENENDDDEENYWGNKMKSKQIEVMKTQLKKLSNTDLLILYENIKETLDKKGYEIGLFRLKRY